VKRDVITDNTHEKRAAETIERLEELRIAASETISDVSALQTHSFLEPDEVRDRQFEPCSVGFSWERNREASADDRRNADADVLTGAVSDRLEVGQNVWFRLQFSIPDSMAGYPVYLRFVARPRNRRRPDQDSTRRVDLFSGRRPLEGVR